MEATMTANARRLVAKIGTSPTSSQRPLETTDPRPEDIASYIAQLSGEMALLARGAKLDLLAYFLEMARLEASNHTDR
jgi:hypothetical protein